MSALDGRLPDDRRPLAARGRLDWSVVAERVCFCYPPVIGVGVIGVLEEIDPGVPGLGIALLLVATVGYTALTLALAAVLFLDARAVRRTGRWMPSPLGNALFALLAPPAAGPLYLHRRYTRFGVPRAWNGWWVVLAFTLVMALAGFAGAGIGLLLVVPELVYHSAGIAAAIAVGLFPVAIHQDAAYVSARPGGWSPNPGGFLGLAFLCLLLPPLLFIVATYYLLRRQRSVGLTAPSIPLVG